MLLTQGTVEWNQRVGQDCIHLRIRTPNRLAAAAPGQFVMVQAAKPPVVLLRRPFSIYGTFVRSVENCGIELLVKVVGKATAALAALGVGDPLDLLGPVGTRFVLPETCRRIYLVAGGIGVAPIRFLAQKLKHKGYLTSECRVFLGGRSRQDLLCQEEFERLGLPVQVTTDDGSAGKQCRVTDPLTQAIFAAPPDIVFACGPMPMLDCIAGIVRHSGVACQVSIETMMACGMGACLGCAVKPRPADQPYRHACMDGPVFDIQTIELS